VEVLRLSQNGAGRVDREDNRCKMPSHLLPSSRLFVAVRVFDSPQQTDETRERGARVHVESARRE